MPTAVQQPARSSKIQKLLASAIDAHKAGRLDEAKKLYIDVLSIDVKQGKSLYGLGLIAHQSGSLDVAASMMQRALACDPKDSAVHRSLGTVLIDQGKTNEAIAAYETA